MTSNREQRDALAQEASATLAALGVPCVVRDGWVALQDAAGLVERLTKRAAKLRAKHHDGCAWCCASTPPERRGEGHKICSAP